MDYTVGQLVFSKAGRDKGYPMLIYGVESDFVTVVDGKERPLSRPKKKNPKHLSVTKIVIDAEDMTNDAKIRRILKQFIAEE